ncbi:MAG TPA: M15 family peptidase [Nitrospirae bacterium]|nr:M15 family peptidase [Nitrospirota bacterium]
MRLTNLSAFLFILLIPLSTYAQEVRLTPLTCTYEVSVWNVHMRRIINSTTIEHPYSELTQEEIDSATGCTVCSEDQVLIHVPPLNPFSVCYKLVPDIRSALIDLVKRGEALYSIRGYLVIKSRGLISAQGNRTQFSNHSFGAAIDINREQNGLYDGCQSFGPGCRLILGGPWEPGVPGTLEANGPVVQAMSRLGFAWGGEIKGNQKDFMHFSITGY